MIVLRFRMQGGDIIDHTSDKHSHYNLQEEDILEHITLKCHIYVYIYIEI